MVRTTVVDARVLEQVKFTHRYCNKESDGNSSRYGQRSLLIVLTREECWILQSTMCTHEGELSSTDDGVGLEARSLEKGVGVEVVHLRMVIEESARELACKGYTTHATLNPGTINPGT